MKKKPLIVWHAQLGDSYTALFVGKNRRELKESLASICDSDLSAELSKHPDTKKILLVQHSDGGLLHFIGFGADAMNVLWIATTMP